MRTLNVWETVLKSVATITLCLWIGGLVAIGAIVAPLTFHVFRSDPAFLGRIDLQNQLAANIIGGSFRNFNRLCEVSGAILTACLAGLTLRTEPRGGLQRKAGWSSVTLSILLTISALCLDFIVFPAMDAARAAGGGTRARVEFDRLHLLYVNLSNVQLIGLLIVVIGFSVMSSVREANR